jgi:hypothetical protein
MERQHRPSTVVLLGTKQDLVVDRRLFLRDKSPLPQRLAQPQSPLGRTRAVVAAAPARIAAAMGFGKPDPRRPLRHRVCPFDWLPDELVLAILWYVGTPDMGTVTLVARRFHHLLNDREARYGRRLPRPRAPLGLPPLDGCHPTDRASARPIVLNDNLVRAASPHRAGRVCARARSSPPHRRR